MLELDVHLRHARVEHPDRLLEQLLTGLVALEDDNAHVVSHARDDIQGGRGAGSATGEAHHVNDAERCTWCGARVERGDGFRLAESPGERCAVFCRLEHLVPWALKGPHWNPGVPVEPVELDAALDSCAHCDEPLGDVRVTLIRHRGEHRIPDAFCSVAHGAAWARAGGGWR